MPRRVRLARDRTRSFFCIGFAIKKDSPSSGLLRVKVYNEHGMAQRNGTGMFPREVMKRFPLLPLEEEGRLNDLPLRENFIERVLPVEKHDRAYYRWTEMLEKEPTPGGLVKFHTAHKLTLMAHGHWKAQWLGTIPRWAALSPMPASEIGTNWQPSTALN